jgi:hypothetical protein
MSDPEQHAGEVVDVVVCLVAFAERVEVVCKRFFVSLTPVPHSLARQADARPVADAKTPQPPQPEGPLPPKQPQATAGKGQQERGAS